MKLKDAITDENSSEIFARAAGKSVRDVLIIAAALNPPAPNTPATFRKVPVARSLELGVLKVPEPVSPLQTEPSPVEMPVSGLPAQGVFGNKAADPSAPASPVIVIPVPKRGKLERTPLAEDQFRLTMLVRRAVVEKADRLKKALSHVVPDGDLAKIVEICFDAVLEKHAKKHAPRAKKGSAQEKAAARMGERSRGRNDAASGGAASGGAASGGAASGGAAAGRAASVGAASGGAASGGAASGGAASDDSASGGEASDSIPADVAADVWTACDGRCQWLLANGEKCGSEHQVQYDHRVSRAKGGRSTRKNLWLLCRLHNILKARLEFGEAHMAQFVRGSSTPVAVDRR